MSVKIKLKHSSVVNKAPQPSDLDNGELALNTNAASPAAYIKDSNGNIVQLAGAGAIGGADATTTAKGIVQLADAAAITAGTAGRVVDAAQLKAVSDADDWTRTGTVLSPATAGDVVNISAGTAALPGLTPVGDPNTGIYSPGADQVAVATGGTGRVFVDSTGKVGIGTAAPVAKLDVWPASIDAAFRGNSGVSVLVPAFEFRGYNISNTSGGLDIRTNFNNTFTDRVRIKDDGNVLIGGTLPASPNISLNADGSASFAGEIRGADSQVTSTRSSGTLSCFSAQLAGAEKAVIKADGSATFGAGLQLTKMSPTLPVTSNALQIGINGSPVYGARIAYDGTSLFAGAVTATVTPPSDARFKENIAPANPQLADVVALGKQLKNFDWNDKVPLNDELRAVRQLGLIAQEAEKVSPGIVKTIKRTKQGKELTPEKVIPAVYKDVVDPQDEENFLQELVTPEQIIPATYEEVDDSFKGISHDALIMKLLGAVAELSAEVEALKAAK